MSAHIEQQSWEKYWSLESLGIHEYTGPSVQERQQQNDNIWKEFQRTIEKREDDYYVRLPWKNDAGTLPDNKSIVVKRLQATIAKLKHDPVMFQNYHETIKEQLDQNIIEEVDESIPTREAIIHYLPHQAVLTPNKETTKLRTVYDASAHLKKAPSLNDVIHQGPLFLPKIYDILLRFRIGNVAMICDVEKAFLCKCDCMKETETLHDFYGSEISHNL
ncbi:unnamed protein product [Angiostrongylus costaricensis]|uniref:Reverse transcriptase domain-containing protein n=1 Tax=Angiostrongylus costaricensis TaxID=334426 RepID=A0A0R3PLF1_ANGCS|nr:unnamed protein product [Angiostrongylus costaricensis]